MNIFSERLSGLMAGLTPAEIKAGIEPEPGRVKIPQTQLAGGVNVSQPTVQRWLNGQPIASDDLERVANYFGVTTDWLLGRESKVGTTAAHYDRTAQYLVDDVIAEAREIWERAKSLEMKASKLKGTK